jgi:chitodextrinase
MNNWRSFRITACAVSTFFFVAENAFAAPRDRTPPTTPSNLRVTGASDYSVSLAWNASTDNSGFWYYKLVSSAGVTESLDRTQTSHTFTAGHTAGNTYTFYVYALDGAGNRSPNSNTISATLLPQGTPPSAPVLSVTSVGPTHISLTWTVPFDAGPPVRYWLYRNGQALAIGHQTTSFTLYYVLPETTHTFTVQARDGQARFSPHSAALTVTAPPSDANDTTPPSTPTGLWAGTFGDGSTEFELNWTASADGVTPQAYIRYDLYLNGAWLDSTVGRNRVTEYGEFGENMIEVIAIDEAGNESEPASTVLNIH